MKDNQRPGKNGFKFPEHSIKTRITDVKPNELFTRGYNQEDLITNLSFAEMVFLLLRERLPDERESKIFNHILVSFCDHGVTPAHCIIWSKHQQCCCRRIVILWKESCRSY